MASTDFVTASIPDLLSKLTKEEKIRLLSAPDWWHTYPISRLAIPSAKMSDGPNGVRGDSFFLLTPAQCLPCSTSLASTFDPELINAAGAFLAEEAKSKSATILLAPTCNIQRSPLGGRSFESFSEDPFLSGTCAAAYVNGLQSNGVAATIKHFVANDQEHERLGSSSNVSERALREIYLYPFMIAQRDAKPWAYMTAYNRLNGIHCSENPRLLTDILRHEWGFDGLIMSDWFGTYSVSENINAGLSLEMPGPPRWRTSLLVNHSLASQKISMSTIDARVAEVLQFVQKLAKVSPEIIFNPREELSREATPSIRAFTRKLASSGMVLLRNEGGVLPIKAAANKKVTKLAVIGPNAKARNISGGGSANLKPSYVVTPWQGILDNKPEGVEVQYSVGCYAHKYLPQLQEEMASPSNPSKLGFWHCAFFNHDPKTNTPLPKPLAEYDLNETRILLNDFLPEGITDDSEWSMVVTGIFTPVDYTGVFEFGLTVAGRAKLYVNDELVVDNWTKQRPGGFFDNRGTLEETGLYNVTAGKGVNIRIDYINTPPPGAGEGGTQASPTFGLRLGGAPKIDADQAIKEAVQLASQSDVVVVIAGLSHEWESEGYDRSTLDLPGKQDELIEALAEVNKNVVVVVQAGSATTWPWHTKVASILQSWYSGNEAGNAIADVLYGNANPSGKLPLTFPKRLKDVPSYLNYGSEQGQVWYREDLFVGYKWYRARAIEEMYPFGFGLSYTTFEYGSLRIARQRSPSNNVSLEITFTITNTGSVVGSETPQVYVSLPSISIIPTTPQWQLRGFSKVKNLKPGEKREVSIVLDKYAFSFWDVTIESWRVCPGKYGVNVGRSSLDLDVLGGEFTIEDGEGCSVHIFTLGGTELMLNFTFPKPFDNTDKSRKPAQVNDAAGSRSSEQLGAVTVFESPAG